MKRLLRKLLNVQPGEGRRVALMTAYLFLLIATLLVIKPVRNSLFLNRFGVEMLPYAFLTVAGTSAIFVAAYTRLAARLRLDRLIQTTLGANVALSLAFWLPLQLRVEAGWFYFVLYVWVALFGVLVTTQFWLLANYVFNVREAKRVFGVLGAGGIAGGIFGGYFTTWLAPLAGSEDLLLFGGLFLIVCMGLVHAAWEKGAEASYREQTQRRRKRPGDVDTTASPLRLLRLHRLLAMIATLVGISVIVANLVDYQYSAIASRIITDEDELTAFFGFWLSTLSVFSLALQLFLTGRIIRRFGVGASLYFLPGGVALGAVGVLLSGGLASAVGIKLMEGGFKQSVHKAGLELLNLPVPAAVKNRVKAFIDVFIDNIATGIGGLLLIAVTAWLGWDTATISVLILALLIVWFVVNVFARRAYIQAFRTAIEKRTLRLEEHRLNTDDPELLHTVVDALDSGNEKQVLYALDLVEGVRHDDISRRLGHLLREHSSRDITVRVLRMAASAQDNSLTDTARELTDHNDPEVRLAAVAYLVHTADDRVTCLRDFFTSDVLPTRVTALRVAAELARHDRTVRDALPIREQFEKVLLLFDEQNTDLDLRARHNDDPRYEQVSRLRIELAQTLGGANDPDLYPYLHLLLADNDVVVLRAAVRAAGRTQSDEFYPSLLAHLGTKYVRRAARDALAMYGDVIIPELVARLNDPRESTAVRLSIPRVLAQIGTQAAAVALENNIIQDDVILRHTIIQSLNRLRQEYADLRLNRRAVEQHLFQEVETYYWMLAILQARQNDRPAWVVPEKYDHDNFHRARHLLTRALEERLDRHLEVIFRLLGLRYVPEDMNNAYQQVTGTKMDLRANAIEFLDNVLEPRLKRAVLPLVETPNLERRLEKGREFLGLEPPDDRACFEALLDGDDGWLKVCAVYYIGESGRSDLYDLVHPHLEDSDPMVRETATLAAGKIDDRQQRLDL